MYQGLVGWYWAVPYIVVLIIIRNLPAKTNRSGILYVGMAMIMGASISVMLLGRNSIVIISGHKFFWG